MSAGKLTKPRAARVCLSRLCKHHAIDGAPSTVLLDGPGTWALGKRVPNNYLLEGRVHRALFFQDSLPDRQIKALSDDKRFKLCSDPSSSNPVHDHFAWRDNYANGCKWYHAARARTEQSELQL